MRRTFGMIAAGTLAGAGLAAQDAARGLPGAGEGAAAAALALFAGAAAIGGAAGLLLEAVRRAFAAGWKRAGGGRPLASTAGFVVLAVAALPPAFLFTGRLFSGPAISRHPLAPLFRIVAPLLVAAGAAGALIVLDRWTTSGRKGRAALAAAVAAVVIAEVEARAYRGVGIYLWLHGTMAAVAVVLATIGVFLAAARVAGNGFPRWPAAAALALWAAGIALTAAAPPQGAARYVLAERTAHGRRLLALGRALGADPGPPATVPLSALEEFRALRDGEQGRCDAARAELDARLGDRRDWNLLWITVDTLRADRLSFMGHRRKTSPALDRFAAASTVFESAWAQFPITLLSFPSMFHGRYPTATPFYRAVHGRPDRAEGSPTLAEILGRNGFRTGSIPAVAVEGLSSPGFTVMKQGFAEVVPWKPGSRGGAADQAASAKAFLDSAKEGRWFLWVHFMDPHHPYVIQEGFDFGSGIPDRYDSEIAACDAAIGGILSALEASGAAGRTAVFFNADHGEALGEHASWYHGSTLYEEQVHVPLVVQVPGLPARRVRAPAENVDLVPTALDLLQVDAGVPFQGRSLVPALLHGDDPERGPAPFAFAELPADMPDLSAAAANRVAARLGSLKLILDRTESIPALFDLDADPGETRNLAAERPDDVARLSAVISVLDEENRVFNAGTGPGPADAAAALRALLERAATPEERHAALAAAADRKDTGPIAAVIEEELGRPEIPAATEAHLLVRAPRILGARAAGIAARALNRSRAHGVTAAALAALAAQPAGALDGPVPDELAAALAAPPPLRTLAAVQLARARDPRGREELRSAAGAPDPGLAFDAACGLALLGEREGVPAIVSGLPLWILRRPARAVLGLDALGVLGAGDALPLAAAVAAEPFLEPELREALLHHLDAVGGEDIVPALLPLLQAWDPVTGRAAEKIASRRLGEGRGPALRAAAALWATGRDLAGQGRNAEAWQAFLAAGDACGSHRAGVACWLYAARMAHLGGQDVARDGYLAAILRSGAPREWIRAANVLPAVPRDAARSLELVSVAPAGGEKPTPGLPAVFRARIRNTGAHPVPGGRYAAAPVFTLAWMEGTKAAWAESVASALPEAGLGPGEEADLFLTSGVPGRAGTFRVTVHCRSAAGKPWSLGAAEERACPVQIAGPGVAGLDPPEAGWSGASLLDGWWRSPDLGPGFVDGDGSVVFVVTGADPWLLSPVLADRGGAIEVEVALSVAAPGPGATARFSCWYGYDPSPGAPGEEVVTIDLPADGTRRALPGRFPVRDGKGVRLIRLQPCDGPHLVRIHGITIRHR